jgi:hypothetical protein
MNHHNQTKVLTTWFLNLPFDESIDNTKAQSLKFESKTLWSIARRPKKPRKAQEGHLEEGKAARSTKGKKSGKPRKRAKESSNSNTQNSSWNQLPLTLLMQALPLDRHYHVSSLNHPVSKDFNQLCAHTLPLWQWTHQTQTERRMRCYAWDSKFGCFTRLQASI